MRPILSILIPTYNRAQCLERLLCELAAQSQYLPSQFHIEILISDNSSEDNTINVLSRYCSSNSNMSFTRESTNIGAEANILSLLSKAKSPYCWIIGDDDIPVKGLLGNIVSLLSAETPSLIYLKSLWASDISSLHPEAVSTLKSRKISNYSFAKEFHVWITFLSSWIFNIDQLYAGLSSRERITTGLGTNLPQLGWILPLLVSSHSKIFVIDNNCVLATSGNTGGYSIIRTFLINYPKLVSSYTISTPRIRHALIGNSLRAYVPALIMSVRLGGSFRDPGSSLGLIHESLHLLWRYPGYWFFCFPALVMPINLYRALRFFKRKLKCMILKLRPMP